MKKQLNLFTSESVSEGHPDKVADQISDAILDACLEQDPMSHVACETFVTTDYCLIGGEITTKAHVNYDQIAREVIRDIGYTKTEYGFNADTVKVDVKIKTQSPDIAMGVENNDSTKIGAGDQGIMFGYASNETEGYMPLAISLAHKLVRVATKLRKEGKFVHARPDMKSQVTIDYEDNKSPRLVTVLMSIQHDPDINMDEFKKYVKEDVILPVVRSFNLNEDFQLLINPTGSFVIGGPMGDTGLTGRKIIVDTYGGASRHGGGAFSGKDPTKVDRSAAYMARYIAKNVVASGLATKCEVQLAYAIGVAKPVSVMVDTFGTGKKSDDEISEIVNKVFDLRPSAIIKNLDLRRPIYKAVAAYGHMGREDLNVPWEQTNKVDEIKKYM